MKIVIIDIKEKAVPIFKEAGITRSSLFGSCVRGEEAEHGDVGILVEYPAGTSLFDVVRFRKQIG